MSLTHVCVGLPLYDGLRKRSADPMGFVALLKQAAGVIDSSSDRGARDEDRRGTERDRVPVLRHRSRPVSKVIPLAGQ